MIKSFRGTEAEDIFNRVHSRKFAAIEKVAFRKLRLLNRATSLNDLISPPGNRLEALRGNRVGQYSIRVNDQLRICFEWSENHAYKVEIVDYH